MLIAASQQVPQAPVLLNMLQGREKIIMPVVAIDKPRNILQASVFVARFVELSRSDSAIRMLPELQQMLEGIGSQKARVTPQEEAALRLKPNKMFKRVRLLTPNFRDSFLCGNHL